MKNKKESDTTYPSKDKLEEQPYKVDISCYFYSF